MKMDRRRNKYSIGWINQARENRNFKISLAEQSAAPDRAGITASQATAALPPARQVSWVVRREEGRGV
jgi:hypothetical protein